ncbi:hypothetical protein ACLMJK_006554 [Lecanora helva]
MSSTTISGPPDSLQTFFRDAKIFEGVRGTNLPIAAPFHAAHLPRPNIDWIIGTSTQLNERVKKKHRLISPSSAHFDTHHDLRAILRDGIIEITNRSMNLIEMIDRLVLELKQRDTEILPIGPANFSQHFGKALDEANVRTSIINASNMGPSPSFYRSGSGDIAVIGFAGRFPGSDTLHEYWENLEKGRDLHQSIPKDRFDYDGPLSPSGCFIDHPGLFDEKLFHMSSREAAQTDPGQRMMMLTTYEALEMAGYSPNRSPSMRSERIGTFFGQTTDDWREHNQSQDVDIYYVSGGIRAFGPGRLNYHFGFDGPSYSFDTACSSSSVAVQLACSALLNRECDTAVAGGSNIITGSEMYAGLSQGGFLSQNGPCKTLDCSADGYCRGEGVGTIILKRVEDALIDRDNVKAIVRAASTNHSARATSITHPHAETQQALFQRLLRQSGLEANDIGYVELHGTGTQAGDITEYESVASVFAEGRSKDDPLFVGTVKANLGHSEAAAGVSSIIKAIMVLERGIMPPHIGIKTQVNQAFPSRYSSIIKVARSSQPFPNPLKGDKKRRILGGNSGIILEEPPEQPTNGEDGRTAHPVVISAKTKHSLQKNLQRLADFLAKHPETKVQDVSYTTTARRIHHSVRRAYVGRTLSDVRAAIGSDLGDFAQPSKQSPKVVFCFTGQGSEYQQMGKLLFETSKVFHDSILEYNSVCVSLGFPSFLGMILDSQAASGVIESQVGLVALEISLANLWQAWGIKPDAVVGHSLGEYSALGVSGVLSIYDTLLLVGKRAELLKNNCMEDTHAMLAIKASTEDVIMCLDREHLHSCEVVCLNAPYATVVGGEKAEVSRLKDQLAFQSTLLNTRYAFHSAQVDVILADLNRIAQTLAFRKPTVPVMSTVRGEVVFDIGVFNAQYTIDQARGRVQFMQALQAGQDRGLIDDHSMWFEIGPDPVLSSMIRANLNASTLASLRKSEDCWLTLSKSLASAFSKGLDINWTEYHREHSSSLRLIELPTYAFDLHNHWLSSKKRRPSTITFSATAMVHGVESENVQEDSVSITFVTNMSDPNMHGLCSGHMVNGFALCPSSVYACMALTASAYAYFKIKRLKVSPGLEDWPAMEVSDMEIFSPLIAMTNEPHHVLRMIVSKGRAEKSLSILFTSEMGSGQQEHARCRLRYGAGDIWRVQTAGTAYLIRDRISRFLDKANCRTLDRLSLKMIYRIFGRIVKYSVPYQLLDTVIMEDELHKAYASCTTHSFTQGSYNSFWLDSIPHLGGFVLNASARTDDDTVYISNGWDSFRIIGQPSVEDRCYESHVRMRTAYDGNTMVGDVYVFQGNEVYAICTGLRFRPMKQASLAKLLSSSAKSGPDPPLNLSPGRDSRSTTESSNETWPSVLKVLASEFGVGTHDLKEDVELQDLGLDSIMTVSVLNAIQPYTSTELPSDFFKSCSTIRDIKPHFSNPSNATDGIAETSSSVLTPTSNTPSNVTGTLQVMQDIIASELGVEPSEVQTSASFEELGLDSILSVSVLGRIKEITGLALGSSFFQEHPTIEDVRRKYAIPQTLNFTTEPAHNLPKAIDVKQLRSNAVLLRKGLPKTLFLVPDGAGSAASYKVLSEHISDITIYGLDSPFYTNPDAYEVSFDEVASLYVSTIRTIQHHGPYVLGGWSLGGIHAFEVARQLLECGEEVSHLFLIDSPCPGTLPPLPAPTIDVLEEAGLFEGLLRSGRKVPAAMKAHFVGAVNALEHWRPRRMDENRRPGQVVAFWAKEGAFEDTARYETSDASKKEPGEAARDWLIGKRRDFSACGWDEFVAGPVECILADANHFTIVREPGVGDTINLSAVIEDF